MNSIQIIPDGAKTGIWVGRCYVPQSLAYKNIAGPHVVKVANGKVYDLSDYVDSTSELLNMDNPVTFLKGVGPLRELGNLDAVIENSIYSKKQLEKPFFLSPNDTQAIKACGVTFIQSLLERVIEEKANGNPAKAQDIRRIVTDSIGTDLHAVKPGSEYAEKLKKSLQEQGIWSQYLEVGIGKDAEIFTKSQPFSAVGYGAEIGVLEDSTWNNPEPEVVMAVSNKGKIVGATLGNDVNLRDYEGRSALLLGEAKDQNGSCAIGPLFRLFDDTFNLDTLKNETVRLQIVGLDGFKMEDASEMGKISRPPEALVAQAIGKNHQYPDGLVLFCGTMFAPNKDRDVPGYGFTHKVGDKVTISSKHLGAITNWVNTCDQLPKWEFGITSFIQYLIKRKLI